MVGWLCAWSGFCVSGWGQDLPTTGPVSSTDHRYGQCYQNPLPRVQWLLIVSAPEHLNCILGYFSSYLWPHHGDLLVRTLQWPLLIGCMCIVSMLKMLSRFALGEKVDTRRWREGCDSRCRGLPSLLLSNQLLNRLLPSLGLQWPLFIRPSLLMRSDQRVSKWNLRLFAHPTLVCCILPCLCSDLPQ